MKYKLLYAGVGIAMAVGLSQATIAFGQQASGTGQAKINLAYHPNMHGGGLVAVGEDQGFFKQEGLAINAVRFTSGAPEIDAMIAGQLDIGYLGPGAMPAVMRGDVQLLTIDHPDANERLIASEDSGVTSVKDLKGKSILFATGTTGEFVVRAALKSAGMAYTDVTAVNSPDESSTTAYISKRAEIISVGPTFTNQAVQARPSKVVFQSNQSKDFSLPGFWIANKQFVKNNPDLVARFLRAFGRANDYRNANFKTIMPVVQKFTGTPEAVLEEQIELTDWWTQEKINAAIRDGSVDKMLTGLNAMFQETGKMTQLADIKTYFDGQATLAAYNIASTGIAARTEKESFPWLYVVLGAFGILMLGAIGFIVRRARA